MIDDQLRELERALRASRAPADRLRLADALARAGRDDDALATLRIGADDPEVRMALARFPAWSDRGPWAAMTIDARPIRTAPVVRWRVPLPDLGRAEAIAASPLGVAIVCGVPAHALGPSGAPNDPALAITFSTEPVPITILLDPETGQERVRIEGARRPRFVGDRLIVDDRDGSPVMHDASTGALISDIASDLGRERHRFGSIAGSALGAGLLLMPAPRSLDAHRFDGAGVGERAWRASRDRYPVGLAVAGTRVLVWENVSFELLDAATGRSVFHAAADGADTGQLDEVGVVTAGRRWGPLVCRDADGAELWRHEEAMPLAIAPDVVVAVAPRRPEVAILDRATGEPRGRVAASAGSSLGGFFSEDHLASARWAIARDVVYAASGDPTGTVIAADLRSGRILWVLQREDASPPAQAIAAIGDRVYVLDAGVGGRASVSCVAAHPRPDDPRRPPGQLELEPDGQPR